MFDLFLLYQPKYKKNAPTLFTFDKKNPKCHIFYS